MIEPSSRVRDTEVRPPGPAPAGPGRTERYPIAMNTQATLLDAPRATEAPASLARLRHAIEHAAHLLPAQGPITVFIHHNTLHAFEDLPFDEAVEKGASVFGCQPYLTEDRYREALDAGADPLRRPPGGARAGPGGPGGGGGPLLRHAPGPAAGDAPVPAADRADRGAASGSSRRPTRCGAVRPEVSSAVRGRLIAETRRWVMRDLRGDYDPTAERLVEGPAAGAPRAASPSSSTGSASRRSRTGATTTGKAFTLQALWRVCCDGVRDLPGVRPAAAAAGPPPRPAAAGDRGGHRPAGPRRADPVLRRVPRPGLRPLAAAPARRGVLSAPSARCTASRAASPDRWLRGLAEELGRLEDERHRPAGIDPRVARRPRRRRGGVGRLPLRHAARPAGLGRHGPAGRDAAATGRSARSRRGAWSSSWRSGCCWTGSRWPTRPGEALGLHGAAGRAPGRGPRADRPAPAAERRAAGVPGVPARPGPRPGRPTCSTG